MIRLIILDVEGVITLPGGSHQPWPLADMLQLREAVEALSLPCVLCTGRQDPYGEAVVQALNLFFPLPAEFRERIAQASGHRFLSWPSIFENGAYFYDPLAKRPVPHPALTPDIVTVLQRMRAKALAPLVKRTSAQFEVGKEYCISLNPPLAAGTPSGSRRTASVPWSTRRLPRTRSGSR